MSCIICLSEEGPFYVLHETRRQVHQLCRACTVHYVSGQLNKTFRKLLLTFPCCGDVRGQERNRCKRICSPEYSKFPSEIQDLVSKITMLKNGLAIFCPNSECEGVIKMICDHQLRSECFECKKTCCFKCKALPFHEGMTCYDYEMREHKETAEYLSKCVEEGKMRKCPSCPAIIVDRIDGCNKVVCLMCKSAMCWLCGKDISGEKYAHFESACDLYASVKPKTS